MFVCSADSIRQAVRQIQRWIYAAEHDADVRIRLLHANYAVGNIDQLRQMVDDEQIRKATSVNILALWARATKAQDAATKAILG
jgi:hypothetical protein